MDNLPISPEQNLEQPAPPPPKINPLFIIGGLILIAIILTGEIFIGKYLNTSQNILVKEIIPTPTSYPSPTITTIPGPTANWKTYNFSPTILFKLPQDVKDPLYVNVGHYALETILHNHTVLQIWGADGASPSGGKDNYEEIKKNITNNQVFQAKAIRLNNNEAIEFTSSSTSSEMVWGGEVYQRLRGVLAKTNDGRGLVIIHYTNQAILVNENFESDDLIFDQILSTFKFINQ